MKQIKKVLAIALAMLMLASILPALPLTAGAWNFSSDGYFSWSEAGQPGVGVALLPLPPFESGELNIHYLNGRFYCDPECKVELIGVGFDNRPGGVISWSPVVRDDTAIRGQNLAGPAGSGTVACESPATISQLLAKLNFAIDCMYNGIVLLNTNPNDPEMKKLEGWGTNIAIDTLLTLNLTLHSPYTVNVNEWGYGNYESANAHNVFWGGTASFGPTYAAPAWPVSTVVYAGRGVSGRFGGNINIIRGSEVRGVLIDVPSSGVAPTALGFRDELEIHFAPGDKTTIDNNTTLDTDIAIRVGENNLLHFENCKITNSKYAEETDKSKYHGTAIQLVGNSVDLEGNANPEGNGAVELGLDTGGSCVIEKNGIGVDALAGICRFKAPNPDQPYTLADNNIAINMRHGTYLAKWTDDISMLDAFNVMITVEDPTVWKKGDPILCSGQSRVRNGVAGDLHDTPITEEDLSVIEFQYAGNLMNVFGLKFVPREGENNDYTYPRYVLAGDWDDGQIYNPRLNRWYTSLTNAVYDQTLGGERLLHDGDTLIYFDDVNEQRAVLIDRNITVRAAKAGDEDDIAYGNTALTPKVINPAGYTAKWFNTRNSGSFIQIADGVTVTFGGTDSGTFNIDCNNEGRFAEIRSGGTLNLQSNVNVTNGVVRQGDTITAGSAIYQNGTLNVEGNFNLNGATVYLPVGKVIHKANTFTNNIVVTLADTPEGRDILVSAGATVVEEDNAKIIESAALPTGTLQQYTANGADADKPYSAGTPVIELVLAQYTVTYTDGVDGIVIFADDIWYGRKHGTATPAASAAVTGALTTRTGYDFAGWKPVIADTVTCDVTYVAQWKPYIWIHHSSDPTADPEKVTLAFDEDGEITSFNITTHVYTNYLYGGVATGIDFAVPNDDIDSGLEIYPEYGGQHFYLREVSKNYLRPAIISVKPHSSTPHNEIKHYLVTVIDANGLDITEGQVGENVFYTEYGFAFDKNNIVDSSLSGQVLVYDETEDGDKNAANYCLYETIGLYKFQDAGTNPQLEREYTPNQLFNGCLAADYFGCAALEDNDNFADIKEYLDLDENGEKSFTFVPYYITADGVVVTGAWEEIVNTKINTNKTAPTVTATETGSVCEAQEGGLFPQAPARMSGFMVSKTFAMIPQPAVRKINVSVIADGIRNQLSVPAGNIAGKVTAPAIPGMIFAGWYSDAGFRTAADLTDVQSDLTVFGKYISARYFSNAVITTVSKGKLCKLRFITAIDDINYAGYGMNITVNGETTNYVLTKTYASVSGYKAQKIFGTEVASNAKLLYRDICTDHFADGTVVTVTPYFVTLDGTTINGMTMEIICHAGSIEMR